MTKNKKTVPKGKAALVDHGKGRRVNIDIVTGMECVSVYFDPDAAIQGPDVSEDAWQQRFDHLYEPGVVIKDHGGDIISVKLGNRDVFKMNAKAAVKVTVEDDEGVEDILKLRDFSEMSLIHSLRTRYARDDIYTSVGPILISINPYKWLKGYYGETTMVEYRGQKAGQLPPHVFALADGAYNLMMKSGSLPRARNQSIIISGESGAGKTEATKVIMQYLAKITTLDTISNLSTAAVATATTMGGIETTSPFLDNKSNNLSSSTRTGTPRMSVGDLEQRVLDSNPMLEAFGNARTLRNDNSSRFGKFIKIQFSKKGRIIGATIEKYLLEKTRINFQMEGERNFHVFYQLIRGASLEVRQDLDLVATKDSSKSPPSTYRYLSGLNASDSISEAEEEFELTCQCMASVGIGATTRGDIFAAIAGILHLGNVDFDASDSVDSDGVNGAASGASQAALMAAAKQLGLDVGDLLIAVTKQNMHVDKQVIVKQLTHVQAIEKRDSLARIIYSALFNWLVDKINYSIAPVDKVWAFIGVLDIYGFENFQSNGFEQLLINYANEKLQNHFNKHIFQIEQVEYESEGIDWSYVTFYDNQPCVELIDGRPNNKSGIFQTLDDASGTNRMDVNSSFLAQINTSWSECKGSLTTRHPNYLAPRFNSDCIFGIQHYAGEVFYNIAHFAEKNRDSTSNDLRELLLKSSNVLLREAAENCCGDIPISPKVANSAGASTAVGANTSSSSLTSVVKNQTSSGSLSSTSTSTGSLTGAIATTNANLSGKRNATFTINKLKEDSISKQFCSSLKLLSDTLDSTDPHYVRCMKPNGLKCPNTLHAVDLRSQLRNAGMMETIRIRKQGYASRQPHKEFFQRYLPLAPKCATLRQLVDELSKVLSVSSEAWQVGTTKIFLKSRMSDQLDRLLLLRCAVSSRRIQKAWRFVRRYRAARNIQKSMRRFVTKRKFLRTMRVTMQVQALWRRHRAMKMLRKAVTSVMKIQSVVRGKAARLTARRLRNPYNRMTYEELTQLLVTADVDLENACFLKDFDSCDAIECTMRDLQAARNKLPLPHPVPASRCELELFLLENKFAQDYALTAQDASMCLKLQIQQAHLESWKASFRTVQECQDTLKASVSALNEAMTRKEFKRCAQLQADVTTNEQALDKAIKANAHDVRLPIATLRDRKVALEVELATALNDKQFDKCSELQPTLDRIIAEIEHRDCGESIDVVTEKVKQTTIILEAARLKKNFRRMAEVHGDLVEFTGLLDALKNPPPPPPSPPTAVNDIPAMATNTTAVGPLAAGQSDTTSSSAVGSAPPSTLSRFALLEQIKTKQAMIDEALSVKKYQLCDTLNAELTILQSSLATIPTAASIGRKLKELETELAILIAKKFYSKCEHVEAEIAQLKPIYDKMLAEEREEAVKMVAGQSRQPTRHKRRPSITAMQPTPNIAPFNGTQGSGGDVGKVINKATGNEKPVSKLRPKVPVTVLESETIASVAIAMSARRVDAALLVDAEGRLAGIITDNDITRRVVSDYIDPLTTPVSQVMTKSPKCVQQDDSALDALELMVAHRFRHLPVLDRDGAVVGLLDIAKCLYEAISALEQVQSSGGMDDGTSGLSEAVMMAMHVAGNKKGANKRQLEGLQKMMESVFNGSVPTLKTIVGDGELPSILPTQTVREASQIMAKVRKGVLVMDDNKKLVGIFTPKDILNRIVAQGLSADVVMVSDVMTPNPDTVSADLSLLDALREMHDHKFLHLPVRENADEHSRVVGLVDVMQLVCSTAGGEEDDGAEGGDGSSKSASKGWRDFFRDAFDATRGDTESDAGSDAAAVSSSRGRGRSGSVGSANGGVVGTGTRSRAGSMSRGRAGSSAAGGANKPIDDKPVSKLRPKQPLMLQESSTVFAVAEAMASKRVDAALLLDKNSRLSGIITDNDIARRVVSQFVDPVTTIVASVMTSNPKCVQQDDSALDALELMVAHRFRHLPVLDRDGAVVGLLDIAKCLYEAISALEQVTDDQNILGSESESLVSGYEAVMMAMHVAGNKKGANKRQLEGLQKMMESVFNGSVPTLKTIIGSTNLPCVRPSANVREAAILMAEVRKGVLVMDGDNELQGIFTPKDLLCRVVAKGKSADLTAVSSVMTPNPDTVSADLSLLDALREMHDHKFLHLPVRENADEHSRVVGLVDVMQLVCSTAGGEEDGSGTGKGWRDFFHHAMAARGDVGSDGASDADTSSQGGHSGGGSHRGHIPRAGSRARLGQGLGSTSRDVDRDSDYFPVQSSHSMRSGFSQGQGFEGSSQSSPSDFAFKVVDKDGNTHRIRSSADSLFLLKMAVGEKLNVLSSTLIIRYLDDEKDAVIISSDSSLRDAVDYARSANMPALRLTVTVQPSQPQISASTTPTKSSLLPFGSRSGSNTTSNQNNQFLSPNHNQQPQQDANDENSLVAKTDNPDTTFLENLLASPKKAREVLQQVPKNTWLMGGALTAVAGIALGGIALMKGNR